MAEGSESAELRHYAHRILITALDPLLPFKIGPVKEREARESGLWLASWDAVIEELANAGDNEEAEG